MPNYHVGCGYLEDANGIARVYAGVLSKSGRVWLHKSDVTSEFLAAVVRFVGVGNEMVIDGPDGSQLGLMVRALGEKT
jgi:hypothetical protein